MKRDGCGYLVWQMGLGVNVDCRIGRVAPLQLVHFDSIYLVVCLSSTRSLSGLYTTRKHRLGCGLLAYIEFAFLAPFPFKFNLPPLAFPPPLTRPMGQSILIKGWVLIRILLMKCSPQMWVQLYASYPASTALAGSSTKIPCQSPTLTVEQH